MQYHLLSVNVWWSRIMYGSLAEPIQSYASDFDLCVKEGSLIL